MKLNADQRKRLRRVVEDLLARYRYCKNSIFEEIEAKITNSYEARFHGPTGVISDPTASIAIQNVDIPEMRRLFCQRIERVVNRLPIKEYKLIKVGHMQIERRPDCQIAKKLGIGATEFTKRRDSAFLHIATVMELKWEDQI